MKFFNYLKNIFVVFTLPLLLGCFTVLFYFNIEQTLFTWIIEKILILLTIISYIYAIPLFFVFTERNLKIREAFKETQKKLLSFWWSTLLVYSVYFGFTLVFLIPLYLMYMAGETVINNMYYLRDLILLLFFSSILSIIFTSKIAIGPCISLFQETKGIKSLYKSSEITSFWNKVGTYLWFLGVSFVICFAFLSIIAFFDTGELSIEYMGFNVNILINYLVFHLLLIIPFLLLLSRYGKAKGSGGRKIGLFRKIIYAPFMLLGGIFMIFIFTLLLNFLFRDYDPPIDDSDLILESKDLKEEDNLYLFFKREEYFIANRGKEPSQGTCAAVDISIPEEERGEEIDYYQFIEENSDKAEEFIQENKKAYECFDEMANHEHYTTPLITDEGIFFGETQYNRIDYFIIRDLVKANGIRIAYLIHQNEHEEALEKVLNSLKIGQLILNNPNGPDLGDYLNASALKTFNLSLLFDMTEKINIDIESTLNYLEKTDSVEIDKEHFDRSLKIEYMLFSAWLDNPDALVENRVRNPSKEEKEILANLLDKPSFLFKPNQTKEKFADLIRKHLHLKEDRHERKYPEFSWIDTIYSENLVGHGLFESVIFLVERLESQMKYVNLLNRITRTGLLLNAYENEKGELPEKLEELVPEYISEIPEDPFNEGEEIIYSKEDRKLYFEGEDSEYVINL